MNTRILISLLCAGAVALACGTRTRSASTTTAHAATTHHAMRTHADSMQPKIASSFAVHTDPRGVHFALDVTNATKKSVELAFPSGQQYEFAVMDSVGREVYRWGTGRMFTQNVQNKLLDGGDTIHIDESAAAALPRGTYVAVATLRSSNYPVQQRAEFILR